jgi:hypothetical protein
VVLRNLAHPARVTRPITTDMTTRTHLLVWTSLACMLLGSIVGCSGRSSIVPNSDPKLRRSSAEFAADAAKRQYHGDAPRGGEAAARAQVAYMLDRIEMVNLSDEDWQDCEVWVNRQFVVHVPKMERGRLKRLDFQMIFNEQGKYVPTDKFVVKKVEVYREGKMYDVPVQLAD